MAALALQKMKKKVVQTARRRWTAPDKDRIVCPWQDSNLRQMIKSQSLLPSELHGQCPSAKLERFTLAGIPLLGFPAMF